MKRGISRYPDYDRSGRWCLVIEKAKGRLTLDDITETAREYEEVSMNTRERDCHPDPSVKKKKPRFPVFRERFNALLQGRSVTEFAAFLGMSRQTIGFYLNGDRIPDALVLKDIAEKCEVSTDWLLGAAAYRDRSPNWIPVTDSLPAMETVTEEGFWGEEFRYDISRPVLGCTVEGHMAVVRLTTVTDSDPVWVDELGSEYAIAYWMPLPEGPEV